MRTVHASILAAFGLGVVASCQVPSTATVTTKEPLVLDRSQATGALGFTFLPPISRQLPPRFEGSFAPDLSPTVRIDQVQLPSGDTIANVATLTAVDRKVRRQPWRELYIARFDTSGLSPKGHYRLRVLLDDKELGAVDLAVITSAADLQAIDTARFAPVMVGVTLPIKFRIERRAADQDGDGVPDWRDNCPTIYNPPVAAAPLPPKPATPSHCDYNKSDCDPQELDCVAAGRGKQPDVCACPGGGGSCPAPDACHTAGLCDPSTGTCGTVPVPDGTACSNGNACDGLETCQAGRCTPGAPIDCGGGNPCLAAACDQVDGCRTAVVVDGSGCRLPNGQGVCQGGICGSLACAPGFGDCDGIAANGCEQDLTADIANCGGCGTSCAPSCETAVFAEDWESGGTGWHALDGNPIAVYTEGSACGQFQRETISTSGGRVSTNAGIAVNAGAVYCLTAWIRGTTDAVPFIGVQIADGAGNPTGVDHWLVGLPGYTTGYPNHDTVTPVMPDGNWAFYSKTFKADAGTSDLVIKDENFGNGAADFDMIQLWAGACPSAPTSVCAAPVPSCRAASCTAGVCASNKL
jgi:hypothetical protein